MYVSKPQKMENKRQICFGYERYFKKVTDSIRDRYMQFCELIFL